MIDPLLRLVNERFQRLKARVDQHAAALTRSAAVAAILLGAVAALDRKLERILKKLEQRDG